MSAPLFSVSGAASLALASLWHNRRLSLFTIVIYAAIVAPVTILYLLKVGVISAWSKDLAQDVQSREIDIRGEYSARLTNAEIQRIGELPGVDFIVGEAMALISTRQMRRTEPKRGPTQQIKVRTSTKGDPLLPEGLALTASDVALSELAAKQLGAQIGDTIAVTLRRQSTDGQSETHRLPFRVVHVVDQRKWPGEAAFLRPEVAVAIGNWISSDLDDIAWIQDPDAPAISRFASFRIYAQSIHQTESLRDKLEENGFEAGLRVAAVSRMLFLEYGLNLVFRVILSLSLVGLFAAILLLQWLSIERQKPDLALLLTTGFEHARIRAFVLMQAVALSFMGLALATSLSALAFYSLAPAVLRQIELGAVTLDWPPIQYSALIFLFALIVFSGVSWLSVRHLSIGLLIAALRSD